MCPGRWQKEKKRKKIDLVLEFRFVADSTELEAAVCWPGGRTTKKKKKRKRKEDECERKGHVRQTAHGRRREAAEA